jgi:hypothetical protein
MKNSILTITLFLYFLSASTQTSSDIGKIALSVIMPENHSNLNGSQISKLETKITKMVSANGLSANGFNHNFVIYPKFEIYETNVIEGGIQNIVVTTCELNLVIKQIDNNLIFSTISTTLKGSGKNTRTSITSAIGKVNPNDENFKLFIEKSKIKIIAYYESICNDLIMQSENLIHMQKYSQAMGLLMRVPEEINCYINVQEKSIEAYKAHQNQQCSVLLQNAKAELAFNQYNSALNILSQIDPSTECFSEADVLVNKIDTQVDREEKKQCDLQMKIYGNKVELEKIRINSIKEIAVSYYKSKPTTINYTNVIK